MVGIRDIPLVVPLANYVWGGIDGDAEDPILEYSPDLCLNTIPFMTIPCWKQGIVKALGIGIILGSFLNKAPIMINIWNTKSAEGLAKANLYGDVLLYTHWFCYGILQNFPITAYGENGALLLQSIIIVIMMWYFQNNTSTTSTTSTMEKWILSIGFLLYIICIFTLLTPSYQYLLISTSLPITIYGRGSQIIETYQMKHCGAQSIITLCTTLIGLFIRIITTISELKGDITVLFGMIVGLIINGTLVIQYFYYKSNTEKFLMELAEEQKKKSKKE